MHSRRRKEGRSTTPYTPQQLATAIAKLKDPLNIIILLDYLTQVDDPTILVSQNLMPRIRGLVKECLSKLEKDQVSTNKPNGPSPLPGVESLTQGMTHGMTQGMIQGMPQGIYTSGFHALQNGEMEDNAEISKVLHHLYMLLEAMLNYKNPEISASYLSDCDPEECISLIINDNNIERKALALRISASLLAHETTNAKKWCDSKFFGELLKIAEMNPQRENIKKSIINLLSTLVRKELLSPDRDFSWIEEICSQYWTQFESLFPQDVYDEDYYLSSCSLLEILHFQVAKSPEYKKRLQTLNDRLKISKWNYSNKGQLRVREEAQMGIEPIQNTESKLFADYTEISRQVSNQEVLLNQLKKELDEDRKISSDTSHVEVGSRRNFYFGLFISAILVTFMMIGGKR